MVGGMGVEERAKRSMIKALVVGSALLVLALRPGPARSETSFDMPGELRYRINWLTDFGVNENGRELSRKYWEESRLRLSPSLKVGDNLAFYGQADFFSGRLNGDYARLRYDYANWPYDGRDDYKDAEVRQLWMNWQSPAGILRVGQMSSQWGLGLLSNDGENRLNEFGDSYMGDLYQRVLFATKPLAIFNQSDLADRLVLAVGYDVVWRDENAVYQDGDRGSQWVFSSFYDDPDHLFTGVYVALRNQEDDDGDKVKATAYDLYFNWKSRAEDNGPQLSLGFEGIILKGWTDRVILETSPKQLDLDAIGGVVRTGLTFPDSGFRLGFEAGYASGDANSYDQTNYALSFDPDYNVGIVLFQEVMSTLTAYQPEPLADPMKVNVPQKGIDQLPGDGAVTNAVYQNLIIAYSPPDGPAKGLTLKEGILHAAAAEDFMDPYQTFKNGGVPTNYKGAPAGKDLGWELDTAVSYQYEIGSRLKLTLGLEHGYFMPGDAFNNRHGDPGEPIQKLQGRATASW
ncbi:MAG TPA: hypothetical protein VM658_13935 [bacterium]|nr:hypothetical protein [bacterium]